MFGNTKILWEQVNEFILSCGNVMELYAFSIEVVKGIRQFCRYDQAVVHFLDGNQKIVDHYIVNMDERWNNAYLEYYTKAFPEKYGYILAPDIRENPKAAVINLYRWDDFAKDEFIVEYIRPRGLKYTLSFLLFDLSGTVRTVIALDRVKDRPFTENEIELINVIVPHLNIQHKKFFMQSDSRRRKSKILEEMAGLTKRETEIVHLLCDGAAPSSISKILHISANTTHKHIMHIYGKMNVSNLQELLVKLLGTID